MKQSVTLLLGMLILLAFHSCSDHETEIDMNKCVEARIVSISSDKAVVDILLLPPLYCEAYRDSIHPNLVGAGIASFSQMVEEDGKPWFRYNLTSLKPNTSYEFEVSVKIFLGDGKDCLQFYKDYRLTPANNYFTTPPDMQSIDLGLSVLWGKSDLGIYSNDHTTFVPYNWTVNPIFGLPPSKDISGSAEDPVTAILGDGWRMPTVDEMQELIDKCKWESMYYYKTATGEIVTHYKKVSGKGVFSKAYIDLFPYKNRQTLDYIGTYWTASVSSENTSSDSFSVNCLYFNHNGQSIQPMLYSSTSLYQIRPVKDR